MAQVERFLFSSESVREGLVTMTEKYAISTLENVMKSMIYPG
jgi:hypothetical protein